MKNKKVIALNIIKIILIIILLPIIFFNVVIITDSLLHPNEVPSFFGWKPFIVMSGSMQSELYANDVALVKEVDTSTLKVGDIIAFQESKDFVVTHRIVEITINEEGQKEFITKGDSNNEVDIGTVQLSQIEGKYMNKIPGLGKFLLFIQTPMGTVIAVLIPIILLIILHANENRKNKKTLKNEAVENENLKQEIERLKKQNEELAKEKKVE